MNSAASVNPAPSNTARRLRPGRIAGAVIIDLALVACFAALGRSEHSRAASLAGLFETAWPFLAATLLAWALLVVARRADRPSAPLRAGVPIWLITVAGGLALRGLTGGGLALAFMLVTLGALGALLVGWRLIAQLVLVLAARVRMTDRAEAETP